MKLLIVESPGKIKKLMSILKDDGFIVKASVGHVSDLPKKEMGIDIPNGFKPLYQISQDKQNVVNDLIKAVQQVGTENVVLAADEDREGEAIAFHLANLLKLDLKDNNRITFNSITKDAITDALKTPRTVDLELVRAQEARRVIDRLVGYKISPILWNKLKSTQSGLSAGRVQSAALKLVVEQDKKQKEYFSTQQDTTFKYTGVFLTENSEKIPARLISDIEGMPENFEQFFSDQFNSEFTISDVKQEEVFSNPSAPFITSTLQQDAALRFKIKVADVMKIAQKLYENGFITYLRTDSPTLSPEAQEKIKKAVTERFGEEYYIENKYKSKGDAQEAHECIRSSRFDFQDSDFAELSDIEKKVFNLINDRALASQMKPAKYNKNTIDISNSVHTYQSSTRTLIFQGFKALYDEIKEEDEEEEDQQISAKPEIGQVLKVESLTAKENLPQFPKSYNESTLVKKLEHLGIGRPSTYAAILSNILGKSYIVIGDNKGNQYPLKQHSFNSSGFSSTSTNKAVGSQKNILIPSDTGILLANFLSEHFEKIFNYDFTANIENEFDQIVSKKSNYLSVVSGFYKDLEDSIKHVSETVPDFERPKNYVVLGDFEDKKVTTGIGKFGIYVRLGMDDKSEFASLDRGLTELSQVTFDMAIAAIKAKRENGSKPSNVIKEIGKDYKIINGKFGPCILKGKDFTPIPKSKQENAASLTKTECDEIIKSYKDYLKKKK